MLDFVWQHAGVCCLNPTVISACCTVPVSAWNTVHVLPEFKAAMLQYLQEEALYLRGTQATQSHFLSFLAFYSFEWARSNQPTQRVLLDKPTQPTHMTLLRETIRQDPWSCVPLVHAPVSMNTGSLCCTGMHGCTLAHACQAAKEQSSRRRRRTYRL